MKKYTRQFTEAFPPENVHWGVYAIFSKIPKLAKWIASEVGKDALIKFDPLKKVARGKATMEEDYVGQIIAYGFAKKKYMVYEINTATQEVKAVIVGGLDSLTDILSELKK